MLTLYVQKEEIMSHNFPCIPLGDKIILSRLNPGPSMANVLALRIERGMNTYALAVYPYLGHY